MQFGWPELRLDRNVIPDDDSTVFVCSGMQRVRERFHVQDGSRDASLQSCIRTNDIELVGDGSHLTSFEMVGTFSFGGNDYEQAAQMWHLILRDLDIPVTHVTFHPTRPDHEQLWRSLGYTTVPTEECIWSDGVIGGTCCEVFVGELEVGNLVNPLGHSVDVGFGLERLAQVVEGRERADDTSLFDQSLHPIVRDHVRTLRLLRENGVRPGPKGRYSICRQLVRRALPLIDTPPEGLEDWWDQEFTLQRRKREKLEEFESVLLTKPWDYWWNTHGLSREEIEAYLNEKSGE